MKKANQSTEQGNNTGRPTFRSAIGGLASTLAGVVRPSRIERAEIPSGDVRLAALKSRITNLARKDYSTQKVRRTVTDRNGYPGTDSRTEGGSWDSPDGTMFEQHTDFPESPDRRREDRVRVPLGSGSDGQRGGVYLISESEQYGVGAETGLTEVGWSGGEQATGRTAVTITPRDPHSQYPSAGYTQYESADKMAVGFPVGDLLCVVTTSDQAMIERYERYVASMGGTAQGPLSGEIRAHGRARGLFISEMLDEASRQLHVVAMAYDSQG